MATGAASELHLAVETGQLDRVLALLERAPEEIDARDVEQQTPLHWAAEAGQVDLVRQLVQYGADLWAADAEGKAPVDVAASQEVETYLQAGPCVEGGRKQGPGKGQSWGKSSAGTDTLAG